MGKKSKRRTGKPAAVTASNDEAAIDIPTLAHPDNLIPRQRYLYPEDWDVNMACLHPFIRPEYQYVCIDAEKYISKQDGSDVSSRNKAKQIEHYADCSICFKDATLTCARCGTVSYCSKDCQNAHWKKSHKKACKPNPKPYNYKLKLELFRGLTEDCFEGHEFLVVKPTEQMESSHQICYQVLESADDIFDIPGFGANQLNSTWIYENQSHPVCQKMLQRFGWTSGHIGLELVNGYRAAEARVMYFCFCDDSFQSQMDLAPSYYGRALFPQLSEGKHVRGNLVVCKVSLKNKRIQPPQPRQFPFVNFQMTDDADLRFEFILQPMNKAELAYMLYHRCRAKEQGAYTTRMWRHSIRQAERQAELEAVNARGEGMTMAL